MHGQQQKNCQYFEGNANFRFEWFHSKKDKICLKLWIMRSSKKYISVLEKLQKYTSSVNLLYHKIKRSLGLVIIF